MFKNVKLKTLLLFVAILGSLSVFSQEEEKVSDVELDKFAVAYINLQAQNQEAQEELMAIIEKEGLPLDRFNAIQKSNMENTKVEASDSEIKMHAKITVKIQELQPTLEAKAMEGIKSSGLTVEQFEEMVAVIQQDQALQQRLQTMVLQKQRSEYTEVTIFQKGGSQKGFLFFEIPRGIPKNYCTTSKVEYPKLPLSSLI